MNTGVPTSASNAAHPAPRCLPHTDTHTGPPRSLITTGRLHGGQEGLLSKARGTAGGYTRPSPPHSTASTSRCSLESSRGGSIYTIDIGTHWKRTTRPSLSGVPAVSTHQLTTGLARTVCPVPWVPSCRGCPRRRVPPFLLIRGARAELEISRWKRRANWSR